MIFYQTWYKLRLRTLERGLMKGLGERIRSIRKARHLTIVDVAKGSGIDQATLSRIENGKMTGTLDSHRRSAVVLGLRLPELYDTVMRQLAESKDKKVLQKMETFSHSGGAVAELLTTGVLQKKMMPVLVRIDPGGKTNQEQNPGGSEKFIFILEGTVEARVQDQKFTLSKHNTLYFEASLPHSFTNIGKGAAKILCIGTPVSL